MLFPTTILVTLLLKKPWIIIMMMILTWKKMNVGFVEDRRKKGTCYVLRATCYVHCWFRRNCKRWGLGLILAHLAVCSPFFSCLVPRVICTYRYFCFAASSGHWSTVTGLYLYLYYNVYVILQFMIRYCSIILHFPDTHSSSPVYARVRLASHIKIVCNLGWKCNGAMGGANCVTFSSGLHRCTPSMLQQRCRSIK